MSSSGNDGSVTFSTKVDESGFNAGLKNLSASIAKIGSSFKALGTAIVRTLSTVATVAGVALVAALGGLLAVITASIRGLLDLDGYAKDVKTSFENLKLAFATVFQPLVTAALPAIMTIVSWMTRLLTLVQMYIAAFLGQKTIMQATANTAANTAKSTGQMAKNTQEAGKAAKGALAAFDELNVLQLNDPNNPDAGGVAGAIPDVSYQTVPIENTVLSTVAKIQKWFADTWKSISDGATAAWNWIVNIWNIVATWFKANVIDPLMPLFTAAWDWLVTAWGNAGQWFQDNVIGPIGAKFNELVTTLQDCGKQIYDKMIQPLASWFMEYLWPIIQKVIGYLVENFKKGFDLVVVNLGIAWNFIVSIFQNIFIAIKDIVTGMIDIFQGLIKYLTGLWTGDWKLAWEGVRDIFKGVFEGIYGIVKLVINNIIDLINCMVQGMTTGLNAMIGGLNTIKLDIPESIQRLLGISGGKWGINLAYLGAPAKIPHLATGAVIPPNSQFAAILGDQRRGTNIEAPEDLIRQIIREESGNQPQRVTIDFGTSSMGALIRSLNPVIKQENDRIGSSLIDGMTA